MTIKQMIKRILPNLLWNRLHFLRVELANLKYQWKIKRYKPRIVEHLYGDTRFSIMISDPQTEAWYDHDNPVPPEIRFVKNHQQKSGAKIFDIGAYQCISALMLADLVGKSGSIIAVEAHPFNVKIAKENLKLNNVNSVTVVHAGAGDKEQALSFATNLNSVVSFGRERLGKISVNGTTVDRLMEIYGRPRIIIIDVEGFECQVLAGSLDAIACGTDFLIETHVGKGLETLGGSVDKLLSFFPKGKYKFLMSTDDHSDFIPFDTKSDMVKSRFFLASVMNHFEIS